MAAVAFSLLFAAPCPLCLLARLNYTRVAGLFITVSGNPNPRRRHQKTKGTKQQKTSPDKE